MVYDKGGHRAARAAKNQNVPQISCILISTVQLCWELIYPIYTQCTQSRMIYVGLCATLRKEGSHWFQSSQRRKSWRVSVG